MTDALPLQLFDYDLPPERIAQAPVRPRDTSRLMVLERQGRGAPQHRHFFDLPNLLTQGDILVVNRTQVIPARLHVQKATGGRVELLFVRPLGDDILTAHSWEALARPAASLKAGTRLVDAHGFELHVDGRESTMVRLSASEPILPYLRNRGEVPLPPYIRRDGGASQSDREDYQTVFGQEPGAVAAPTASLHFSARVLQALRERGVRVADVTLHVGPGTFLPVRSDCEGDVRKHKMHAEWYHIPEETRVLVREAKAGEARVVAVGTTSVRAVETWWKTGKWSGDSELFIYPGYEFGPIDGMITNFHLPRSTLLMLVSAFCGRERLLAAYGEAVHENYRFFSYGDAMLII